MKSSKGDVLEDDNEQTAAFYKIFEGSTVHVSTRGSGGCSLSKKKQEKITLPVSSVMNILVQLPTSKTSVHVLSIRDGEGVDGVHLR